MFNHYASVLNNNVSKHTLYKTFYILPFTLSTMQAQKLLQLLISNFSPYAFIDCKFFYQFIHSSSMPTRGMDFLTPFLFLSVGVRKLMPVLPFTFANGRGGSEETPSVHLGLSRRRSPQCPLKGADINVAPQNVVVYLYFYLTQKVDFWFGFEC